MLLFVTILGSLFIRKHSSPYLRRRQNLLRCRWNVPSKILICVMLAGFFARSCRVPEQTVKRIHRRSQGSQSHTGLSERQQCCRAHRSACMRTELPSSVFSWKLNSSGKLNLSFYQARLSVSDNGSMNQASHARFSSTHLQYWSCEVEPEAMWLTIDFLPAMRSISSSRIAKPQVNLLCPAIFGR